MYPRELSITKNEHSFSHLGAFIKLDTIFFIGEGNLFFLVTEKGVYIFTRDGYLGDLTLKMFTPGIKISNFSFGGNNLSNGFVAILHDETNFFSVFKTSDIPRVPATRVDQFRIPGDIVKLFFCNKNFFSISRHGEIYCYNTETKERSVLMYGNPGLGLVLQSASSL